MKQKSRQQGLFGFKPVPPPQTRTGEVFKNKTDKYYFTAAKSDVVSGFVLQGKSKEAAGTEFDKVAKDAANRVTNLVHSERVLAEYLKRPDTVEKIAKSLFETLKDKPGEYHVMGAVLLGYSTNTICQYCTPTLIALQNSHEDGGFLNMLIKETSKQKDDNCVLTVPAYNESSNEINWSLFRMNTIISANIDFDEQPRDLADEGQHQGRGNTKPPKETHNPHAKLFFPDDEINLASVNPYQTFFYEFVGKDMHTGGSAPKDFDGITFASGS